jgi:hypothetical protein
MWIVIFVGDGAPQEIGTEERNKRNVKIGITADLQMSCSSRRENLPAGSAKEALNNFVSEVCATHVGGCTGARLSIFFL